MAHPWIRPTHWTGARTVEGTGAVVSDPPVPSARALLLGTRPGGSCFCTLWALTDLPPVFRPVLTHTPTHLSSHTLSATASPKPPFPVPDLTRLLAVTGDRSFGLWIELSHPRTTTIVQPLFFSLRPLPPPSPSPSFTGPGVLLLAVFAGKCGRRPIGSTRVALAPRMSTIHQALGKTGMPRCPVRPCKARRGVTLRDPACVMVMEAF